VIKEELIKNIQDRKVKYDNVKGSINSFTSSNKDKIKQFRTLARLAHDDLSLIADFTFNKNNSLNDIKGISPYNSVILTERQKYFDELNNLGYQVKEVGKCLNCEKKSYNASYIVETEEEIKNIKYCCESCQKSHKEREQLQVDVKNLESDKKSFNIFLIGGCFMMILIFQGILISYFSKKYKVDTKKYLNNNYFKF